MLTRYVTPSMIVLLMLIRDRLLRTLVLVPPRQRAFGGAAQSMLDAHSSDVAVSLMKLEKMQGLEGAGGTIASEEGSAGARFVFTIPTAPSTT